MPKHCILVVDDDKEVVRLMRAYLEQAGYGVLVAYNGESAMHILRRERPDHTLQPTALINEAYLRLVTQDFPEWQSRRHFYGVAAQLMRQILLVEVINPTYPEQLENPVHN